MVPASLTLGYSRKKWERHLFQTRSLLGDTLPEVAVVRGARIRLRAAVGDWVLEVVGCLAGVLVVVDRRLHEWKSDVF